MSYDEATKCLDRASKIEPNDPWIRLLKSLSEAKLNSGITLNKVAYVGLSGPLLYDYKNRLNRTTT